MEFECPALQLQTTCFFDSLANEIQYDLCTDVLISRLQRKYSLHALWAHNTSSGFCITNKNKLHVRNFTCRNTNAIQHKKAVNLHRSKVTKLVTIKNR